MVSATLDFTFSTIEVNGTLCALLCTPHRSPCTCTFHSTCSLLNFDLRFFRMKGTSVLWHPLNTSTSSPIYLRFRNAPVWGFCSRDSQNSKRMCWNGLSFTGHGKRLRLQDQTLLPEMVLTCWHLVLLSV